MPDQFSTASRELFAKKMLVHVASLGADGEPHATPVWCELDGDDVIINTALGRAKARNLANDPRVALSAVDPDNPYSVIAVRGTVVGFTTAPKLLAARPSEALLGAPKIVTAAVLEPAKAPVVELIGTSLILRSR